MPRVRSCSKLFGFPQSNAFEPLRTRRKVCFRQLRAALGARAKLVDQARVACSGPFLFVPTNENNKDPMLSLDGLIDIESSPDVET